MNTFVPRLPSSSKRVLPTLSDSHSPTTVNVSSSLDSTNSSDLSVYILGSSQHNPTDSTPATVSPPSRSPSPKSVSTKLSNLFRASTTRTLPRVAPSPLRRLFASIPPSPTNPYTPLQMASLWLTEQFTKDPFIDLGVLDAPPPEPGFLYKKVANKTRPVATTLPENFRIVRYEHPDPLAGMPPLPARPPDFVPTTRFTPERRAQMAIGEDFLLPEEKKLAEWIVATHDSAFTWTDDERGAFAPEYFAPIEIPHISHVPWVLRQGPIPRGILNEVVKIIEDKWRSGVYEPSSSSYNSRWFCVIKKDGKSLRLVHSLEPLNAVTIRNAAMPPYTDIVAEDFAGRSIYTTLDLYVSFDQRQLHEKSRDMTTFNTPLGSFRLTVLPMGWTNSPAVLQGDVTHILRPEIPDWTQPFADDVPIKGPKSRYELEDGSYETIPENPGIRRFVWEHFEAVHRIVQRVKSYGATFSGKKAFIGVPQAEILGHICTSGGRIPDPARVQAIRDWPVPTNVSEVRAFLGTCGVLRIFIKNYTLIARPLIQLTRKDVPFEIGQSQLDSMRHLKEAISISPALRPLDYEAERPIILAIDSCANGVGYLLLQVGENGKRYPSRFGSITFNDRESRYSQAKLELYGLFRALKHTQLYTIGAKKLVVEMDAKFIKGMINSPTLHPNDAVNRWIAAILLFDFDLVHVPSDKHTGADGLSRRPQAPEDSPHEDPDALDEWIDTHAGLFLEATTPSENAVPPLLTLDVESPDPHATKDVEIERSLIAKRRDERLEVVRRFLETLERPPDLSDDDYRQFLRHASDFFLRDGRLYRKFKNENPRLVPKPPERYRLIVHAHDRLGHKGVYATTRTLLLRFWWPHQNSDVRWFIKTCPECQSRQTEYFHIPPVVPTVPKLFRKVHVDTMLMPKAGSYRYFLHARCAMISYPEGQATTSENGTVCATFLFNLLCRWGAVSELVTDNGTPWIAAVETLSERYHIHHIRVSGYNSQANGIVESKHFDVREAIMKTCKGNEKQWRSVIPQVLWAERVTIRRSTGYSPYYMAHGVHPLLPFDISEATYLAPPQDLGMSTEELVALRAQQLAKRPEDIERMRDRVLLSRLRGLEQFEKQHRGRIIDFDFQPGALVLLRNSRVEDALNRKAKPRYIGPMVIVRKTEGRSYVVAELDGTESQLRVAAFRLIPYFACTKSSVPIISSDPSDDEVTEEDPDDVHYLKSLAPSERVYQTATIPSL